MRGGVTDAGQTTNIEDRATQPIEAEFRNISKSLGLSFETLDNFSESRYLYR